MSVNFAALSIAFCGIKGLAVLLTLFRLVFRFKIRRLWWEDFWAAVALVGTLVSILSVAVVSGTDDDTSILIASRINAYMFTCVIWSVRMSLITAIIRITYTPLQRLATQASACLFMAFWITTLSLQAWKCADDTGIVFAGTGRQDCILPRWVIIFGVAMNCGSDTIAVVFPIKLLWRVKLPARQRRMLLSLFTISRFLCGFALAHSISQLVGKLPVQVILAEVEMTVFLIICNLLVIVTYCYRTLQTPSGTAASSDPSDDDFSTPALKFKIRPPRNLTTVESAETLNTYTCETIAELKDSKFPFHSHDSTKAHKQDW